MSDADAACYAARYADLNGTDAREHFKKIGFNQGRNAFCVANLTNIQAKRYLTRYPELNQRVGVSGHEAFEAARTLYKSKGHKEKHDISVGDALEKPWKCADGGSTCQCKGRVYLGALLANDTGSEIRKFDEFLHWKTESRYTKDGETVNCAASDFMSQDPWPNQPKQCFCEPSFNYQPVHCASEGGSCKCPGGTVFFAKRFKHGNKKVSDLSEALQESYAVTQLNQSDSIQCNAQSFENVDPIPGTQKDCFCDYKNAFSQQKTVFAVKNMWKAK